MVIGAGGVGLNVIQGAAIAGANPIVAVDVADAKLELARAFGATHAINAAKDENVVKTAKKLTGGGPDYCFECIGLAKTVEQAFRSLRKGGKAVVVGVARGDESVAIKPVALAFEEKTLTGSYFGSARPREDFPRLHRALPRRAAQARRTDHASLPRRRGAAGVRRSGRRQERAGRDRVRVSAVAEAPNPLAWLSS